jgi:hypothetical protein
MNPRLRNIIAPAVVFAAVAAIVLLAGEAEADRTVVLTSANATVAELHFSPSVQADGGVAMDSRVCGKTKQSDGGVTQQTCHSIILPPAHAITAAVKALMSGDALTFWKQQEGL